MHIIGSMGMVSMYLSFCLLQALEEREMKISARRVGYPNFIITQATRVPYALRHLKWPITSLVN